MRLGAPAGLAAAALALPLVLWYVLRSRRPRQRVPSTLLFRPADRSATAAVPWQRLRPDTTFWLVLAAILLGAVGLARPYVVVAAELGDHTIVIVDASASMLADEDGPTRLELARREVAGLIDRLGAGQEMSLIEAGPRARALASAAADASLLRRALDRLRPSHAPADLVDAFTLATALQRPGQHTVIHLVTDGALDDAPAAAAPEGLRVTAVGSDRPNLAVTRLVALPTGTGTNQVLVQVRNFGVLATEADLEVGLSRDGQHTPLVSRRLRLGPRATEDLVLELPGGDGEVLVARVTPVGRDGLGRPAVDALDVDDTAYAVVHAPRRVDVVVVGPGNVFLEAALAALPGVELRTAPDLATAGPLDDVDLLVVDRVAAPERLTVPTLLVAPTRAPQGADLGAERLTPTVTTVDTTHPVLASVDLADLAIARAVAVDAPTLTPLVAGPQGPLVLAGRIDGIPTVWLTFDLQQSNLPLLVAWPVLVANTVSWLTGGEPTAAVPAGTTVTLPVPAGVADIAVDPPAGAARHIDPLRPRLLVDQVGIWRVRYEGGSTGGEGTTEPGTSTGAAGSGDDRSTGAAGSGGDGSVGAAGSGGDTGRNADSARPAGPPALTLAVVADPAESDLVRPRPDPVAARGEAATGGVATGRRDLSGAFAVAVLVLAALELLWVWGWRTRRRAGDGGATAARAAGTAGWPPPRAAGGWRPPRGAAGWPPPRGAGLRLVAIAAAALAVLDPHLPLPGGGIDVAFLIDASDSTAAGRGEAVAWVRQALAARPDGARAAVALFGREPRLEHGLRDDPLFDTPTVVVDGSATDLARALRLGQGVVGSERRRRVVVLTDGLDTRGDPTPVVEDLRAAGVGVDIVRSGGGLGADVAVADLAAPSRVRQQEAYELVATLVNTGTAPAEAVVVTTADGQQVDRRTVALPPGTSELRIPRTAERPGTVRYELRLESGASTVARNDVGRAAVLVEGPARVLIYEGEADVGRELAAALDAAGITAERTTATSAPLPGLDRLLGFEAVVLVDVPADLLGDAGMRTLDSYVRDAGRGLVVVGGDDAYGMGGYDGTPLEELLPVFARVTDPRRRPSVAQALVVDVSGSMAACHCRPDGFGGGPVMVEGGVNKTDIAKEAIARAVRALSAEDTVGVLAFNATAQWVIPLQQLPPDEVVDAALARLHPDGPTNVVGAVREAIAGLKDANARLRHIVLFTDGFSEDPTMIQVAREAAEQGITLSVVATGEGTGEVLRDMAAAGGGRYYPGRDLFSIPDIIVTELRFAARPLINEGSFLPVVTGLGPGTDGLEATPPLLGYVATTDKPTATTLLRIGEEHDPLLARWQAGLGTVVAWTSDATRRWSAAWLGWEGYPRFWSEVVRSTFPAPSTGDITVTASATTDGIAVEVRGRDAFAADTSATATVTGPDGRRSTTDLDRVDLDRFAGRIPADTEGVYAVSVTVRRGTTELARDTVAVTRAYPAEYAPVADTAAAAAIDRLVAAGARLVADPAAVWDPEGLPAGRTSVALRGWLLAATLVLLVGAVGRQRVRWEREDLSRIRRWLRTRRRTERAARTETTEALLAAKRRARDRLDR